MRRVSSPLSIGSPSKTKDQRPSKAELIEAKNTAMRRNHGVRSPEIKSINKRSSWSPQSNPPEFLSRTEISVRSCPFETTFVDKERRFPMYNGEKRASQNSYDRTTAPMLSVQDDSRLSLEVQNLYEELLPTPEDVQRKYSLISKLENLLNDEWPGKDFTVHAFGSTENLLATHKSDLDVCIETEWTGFGHQVCQLSRYMAKCGMENVVCRAQAKVPVVAIYDPVLKVSCDMNINNTLALRNTKLVKTYMQIDERARQLTYAVKQWAAVRALNEAVCNTLTSYTWTLMVINFLQTRKTAPVLPSLQQWPHEPMPSIGGIDISFADDLDRYDTLRTFSSPNKESVGSLLFGFFHYYAYEFNYERDVASVRLGCVIDRREKGYPSDNMFCIEEPFTIARNLGNTADMGSHRGIHQELQRAHKLLANGEALSVVFAVYVPSRSPSANSSERAGRRVPQPKPRQSRPNSNYCQTHAQTQQQNQNSSYTQSRQQKQESSAYTTSGFFHAATLPTDELYRWSVTSPQEQWIGHDLRIEAIPPTRWQYLGEDENQLHDLSRLIDPIAMEYYRQRIQNPYYFEESGQELRMQNRSRSQPGETLRCRANKRDNRRNSFSYSPKSTFQQLVDGAPRKYQNRENSFRNKSRYNSNQNDRSFWLNNTLPEPYAAFRTNPSSPGLLGEEIRSVDGSYYSPSCHEFSYSDTGDSQSSVCNTISSSRSSPSSASAFPSPDLAQPYADVVRATIENSSLPPSANETISSHFARPKPIAESGCGVSKGTKSTSSVIIQPAKATYASKLSSPCKCVQPAQVKSTKDKQDYEPFPAIRFPSQSKTVKAT